MRSLCIALAAACAALGSCHVDDLELAGKACPCVDGYVCVSARCVPAESQSTLFVSDLKSTWQTPQIIRWDWTVTGSKAEFGSYSLITGTTQAEVESGGGTTVLPENRPELGDFDARGSAVPIKMWSMVDAKLGVQQFAQVIVTDTKNRSNKSNIASASRPRVPANSLVLFDGTTGIGGKPNPAEFDFKANTMRRVLQIAFQHSGIRSLEFT